MRARLLPLLAVLVLGAALLPAPMATAQVSILGLKNSMVQFLLEQISVPGEFEVTAEAVEEPEDGVTSLVGVTVSDGQGVWLRVGEARLNWSPLRLLRGEIEIGELGAVDVELLRLPSPSAVPEPDVDDAPSDEGFSWPRAPLALQVRDLSLQRVSIAPGVIAQQGLAFDATGALRDEGDIQSARLSLRRTDQVSGRIQLEYVRGFETPSLLVALTAQEAPGGLVAELAGLPAGSASRVDLRAEGPFDAFRVRLTAEADRILSVTGLLTLDAGDQLSAVAGLTATPGPDMDPSLAAALAPRARLSFRAAEGEDGVVTIEEGAFTSAGVQAEANGSWNRETTEAALDLGLSVGPELAALVEGLSWDGVTFEGRVRGPTDALQAAGELGLTNFAAPGASIGAARLQADLTVAPGDVAGTLTGRLDDVAADRLTADVIGPVEISVEGALRDGVAQLASLSIDSALASVSASGSADLGAAEASLAYDVAVADLGPVARAYDVPIAGGLSAVGQADGPFAALRIAGQAALDDLIYSGRELGRLQLDHDVVIDGGAAGDVSLTAESRDYGRATVAAVFDADPERVELASLNADVLGATIDGQGVVELAGPFVTGDFTVSAPDLSTLDPLIVQFTGERLTGAVAGDVSLSVAEGAQDVRANLSIDGFSGFEAALQSAELEADVSDVLGAPSGDASLRIVRLTHPMADLETGTFDIEARSPEGRTSIDAVFALEGIGGPDDLRVASVAGEASATDVFGAPSGDAALRIVRLTHPMAGLETGTLDIEARSPDGRTSIDAVFSLEGIGGPDDLRVASLAGEASATDVLGAPSGDASVRIVRLTHPMGGLEDGTLDVEARSSDGRTSVDAAFSLEGIGGPGDLRIASLAGQASAQDVLGVPDAAVTASLTGLSAADAASVAEADLTFDGAALTSDAPSGAFSLVARGIVAAGSEAPEATIEASLTPAGRAEATARVPSASGGDLRVVALRLDAAVDQALGDDPAIDATLQGERVVAGPVRLRNLRATALGPLSALDLAARTRGSLAVGETPQDLRFETAARLDLAAAAGPSGEVSRLIAAAGPAVLRLREPLRIRSADGVTRLENIALRVPGGRLDGAAALHPDGVEADIELNLRRFRDLRDLAEAFETPLPLASANIALTMQADTRPASASATAALRATQLRIVRPDDGVDSGRDALDPLALEADLEWDGARAAVQAALSGPFGQPIQVRAALPVSAGEGGVPALQQGGPLSGSVTWQGDVAEFWAFVPAPDHVLSGPLDIDLGIGGTVAAPQVTGSIAMAGGQYQNLETGTILTDLTLSTSLAPGGGLALNLTARDGAEGRLEAEVAFGEGELAARLTADGATLVRRDDVTASLSADITAEGPVTSPAITGTVRVDRAEISLLGSLPPSVADLGDVRFVGDPEPEPQDEDAGIAPIDLRIEAPGDIFVRGRGLDSEWSMDLAVNGTLTTPLVTGRIERVRGRLDFLGRNFELVRGAVRFTGARRIDPILDISLAHERDGFTGRIEVTGVASDPELGFNSSPPVPEGEVLPRTIFGADSQSLGPGDALLLANGIAALTGQGGGGSVRNALGLDVLRLDETSDGAAEVSVGKNVTEDVFVGVNQPLDGSASSVEVEVEVYPNLSLRAETGQEEGSTVGVEWRIDF